MASGEGTRGVHPVFVSLLPADCKEDDVRTVFSTYGEVLSIRMEAPGPDGLRTAVVNYDCVEAAEDAEEVLDGQYSIRRDVHRPISVKRQGPLAPAAPPAPVPEAPPPVLANAGTPDRSPEASSWKDEPQEGANRFLGDNGGVSEAHKLWVGSLPPDIKTEELRHVFGTYGTVLKVHIMAPLHKKGKSAFVLYSTREAAEDAIEVLDEAYKIRPNSPWPMQVRRANAATPLQRDVRGPGGSGGGPAGDWGEGWRNGRSRDDEWWNSQDRKGKPMRRIERPCPNCSCMVSFEIPAEWADRPPAQPQPPTGQLALADAPKANLGTGSAPAAPSAAAAPAAAPVAAAPVAGDQAARVHVYANLPASVDEKGLRWVFGQYGEVTSVHVDKGEAFVDFADPYDAETSVMTLDGKYEIKTGFGPIRLKVLGARHESAPY